MNVKISPEFWSDPGIELLSSEAKLATLWMLTNPRLNFVGFAEISEKRFTFETGLDVKALTEVFEALPKSFRRDARGYWIRAFIRRQFGQGESLLRNNFCKPLVRDLKALASPSVVLWVLDEYPELETHPEVGVKGEALRKSSGSTTGGQRAEQSRVRAEKERSGAARQGDPKPPAPEPADGRRPADLAVAVAYFLELGSTEAQAALFFDHYEANDWKQGGRAALRSWRAAARNWVRRSQDGGGPGSKNSAGNVPPAGGPPAGAGGLIVPDADEGEEGGGA